MSNVVGIYDPIFYAQEALQQLEMNLGMANRVYRALDRSTQDKGSIIKIRRPSSFTASAMPHNSSVSSINTETVSLTLDQWSGVTFALTDLELSYTRERIITDHIRPAAVAVANAIDLSLCNKAIYFPYKVVADPTPDDMTDFAALYQKMFDNRVPVDDNWHLMLNGERVAKFQNVDAFYRANESADGGMTQMRGSLGTKNNFHIFANQQVQTGATNTAISGLTAPLLDANYAVGATTVVIKDTDATVASGSVVLGDILTIGNYNYTITATDAVTANEFSCAIEPPLKEAASEDDAVTLTQTTAKKQNLAFHTNALALAMAPLSELGNGRGAQISTVVDPITNISLRARLYYDGDACKLKVSIDALWGVQILDHQMGVRYES